ncbi:unnamed protein product [Caenorhabditis auriculariae]|uniref:Tyrosine-protein kinase n=1 Tax=Caenorhabditis auriculariae TaxID=2777116 RepID=A0A8S1HF65_9PELO|nr:unnamed protein product [Caenorhabditis auriculariae]
METHKKDSDKILEEKTQPDHMPSEGKPIAPKKGDEKKESAEEKAKKLAGQRSVLTVLKAEENTGKKPTPAKTKGTPLVQVPCAESGRLNRTIEDEPYYHGFMTTEQAEKALTSNGEFLVRKTDVGQAIYFILSVREKKKNLHLLIKRTAKRRLYWIHIFACRTVNDLIQYHISHNKPVTETGVLLVRFVPKTKWQLNHEQVIRIKELGSGQFGTVYLCWLQLSAYKSRRQVAVKMLQGHNMTTDDKVKFLREANLMQSLKHPNVVKIFGIAASREPFMIVMEYYPNDSLENALTKGNPSEIDKLNFLFDAAKGLQYLHEKSIIHRDIAARNCLLDADRRVMISDFGLSVVDRCNNGVRERKGGRLPVRSMAPETLKKFTYTKASDVYSYGAMMYEVYNQGREPFYNCQLQGNVLRRAITNNKISLKIGNDCPDAMRILFKHCRNMDPTKRFTFAEIVEYLATEDGIREEIIPTYWEKKRKSVKTFFKTYI